MLKKVFVILLCLILSLTLVLYYYLDLVTISMRLGNNVNGRQVLTEDEKRMQDRLTHVRKTCESYDEWKGKLGTFGTKTNT